MEHAKPLEGLRQLIAVLVAIMPNCKDILREEIEQEERRQAAVFESSSCHPESGAKLTPGVIVRFLSRTLGNFPEPTWGVPQGWQSYVAKIMSLVLLEPVSIQEVMQCVSQAEGGSWHSVPAKLAALGLYTDRWRHPLVLNEVRLCNRQRIAHQLVIYRFLPALAVAWTLIVWYIVFHSDDRGDRAH